MSVDSPTASVTSRSSPPTMLLLAVPGSCWSTTTTPKPLRYQFEAQHAGEYTWDYLEQGPRVWRVRIGRPVGAHV
jgi:hypothetical protein